MTGTEEANRDEVLITNLQIENEILRNKVESLEKQQEKLLSTHRQIASQSIKDISTLKSSLKSCEREYNELKDLCDEKDRSLQDALVRVAVKTDEEKFLKSQTYSQNKKALTSHTSVAKESSLKYGVKEVMRQKAINDSLRHEVHKLVTTKSQEILNLSNKTEELTVQLNASECHKNDLKNEVNLIRKRNEVLENENLQLYHNINNKLLVEITSYETKVNNLKHDKSILEQERNTEKSKYKSIITENNSNIYKLHTYITKMITDLKYVRKRMYSLQIEMKVNHVTDSLKNNIRNIWNKDYDNLSSNTLSSEQWNDETITSGVNVDSLDTNSIGDTIGDRSIIKLFKESYHKITAELSRIIKTTENDALLFQIQRTKEDLIQSDMSMTNDEKLFLFNNSNSLLNQSVRSNNATVEGMLPEVSPSLLYERVSDDENDDCEVTKNNNQIIDNIDVYNRFDNNTASSLASAAASINNNNNPSSLDQVLDDDYDSIWIQKLEYQVQLHNHALNSYREEMDSARQEVEEERKLREELEKEVQNDSLFLMNQLQDFQNKINGLVAENNALMTKNNQLNELLVLQDTVSCAAEAHTHLLPITSTAHSACDSSNSSCNSEHDKNHVETVIDSSSEISSSDNSNAKLSINTSSSSSVNHNSTLAINSQHSAPSKPKQSSSRNNNKKEVLVDDQELNTLKTSLHEYQTMYSALQTRCDWLQGKNQEYNDKNNQLLQTIDHVSNELSGQLNQNSNLSHNLCVSQIQISSMKKQLEDFNIHENNYQITEKEFMNLKNEYELKTNELTLQLSQAKENIIKIQNDEKQKFDELFNKHQQSLNDIESVQKDLKNKNKEIIDMQSKIIQLNEKLETSQKRCEELQIESSELMNQLESVVKSEEYNKLQITSLNVQLDALRIQHQQHQASMSATDQYYDSLAHNQQNHNMSPHILSTSTNAANDSQLLLNSKLASQVELLQLKLKDMLSKNNNPTAPINNTFNDNNNSFLNNTGIPSTNEFWSQDYYNHENHIHNNNNNNNATNNNNNTVIDTTELKRLILRCESLEKQIKSMPASLQIAQAEKRVLENKLSKLQTAADIKMNEKGNETDRVRQELQAFLAVQMAEKEGLNQKIKQQAQTIDQLTRHVHILQSQSDIQSHERENDTIIQSFMKSHPTFSQLNLNSKQPQQHVNNNNNHNLNHTYNNNQQQQQSPGPLHSTYSHIYSQPSSQQHQDYSYISNTNNSANTMSVTGLGISTRLPSNIMSLSPHVAYTHHHNNHNALLSSQSDHRDAFRAYHTSTVPAVTPVSVNVNSSQKNMNSSSHTTEDLRPWLDSSMTI